MMDQQQLTHGPTKTVMDNMVFGKIRNIHFVGIGGIGMSAIAEVLMNQGFVVSGSDLEMSDVTRRLAKMGVRIYTGHRAGQVRDAQVLIYSSAIGPDNVEVAEARRRNIPVIKRAEMLGELMRMKYGIAVAGTHGKTTTAALIGTIVAEGGLDPTLIIGGRVNALGSNARLGHGDYLVAEADEFDRSLQNMFPTLAVITNVENDHMECYRDENDLKNTFISFANRVPFHGKIIACLDNPGVREMLPQFRRAVITYGLSSQADISAKDLQFTAHGSQFDVVVARQKVGRIALPLPGRHNLVNSLAGIAVGLELEIPFHIMQRALAQFRGIRRRFEVKAESGGAMVVDDYGHHPTEIAVTLQGARSGWPHHRILAVFQPHLYTRTRDFYREFARAFLETDVLVVTGIYPAREEPIAGVTGELIAAAARDMGHPAVFYIPEKERIAGTLLPLLQNQDMIIVFGAGDSWRISEDLAAGLRAKMKLQGETGPDAPRPMPQKDGAEKRKKVSHE